MFLTDGLGTIILLDTVILLDQVNMEAGLALRESDRDTRLMLMKMEIWRDAVAEPDAKALFEALEDPRWDFRTITGLARSTGLPIDRVKQLIDRHRRFIRTFPLPDDEGNKLYTLEEKHTDFKEALVALRSFVTKSRPRKRVK